jgi:hypothetical protein
MLHILLIKVNIRSDGLVFPCMDDVFIEIPGESNAFAFGFGKGGHTREFGRLLFWAVA